MGELLSKEEIQKYMSLKGEVRGMSLTPELDYVLKHRGPEAVKKAEDELAKLGFPIQYKRIRPLDYYPLGYQVLIMVVLQRLFGYTKEDFADMGREETEVNVVIRLFMKYFVSMERAAKEMPDLWRKYFTVGDLDMEKLDKKHRYGLVTLKNFDLIPEKCYNVMGFMANVVKMLTGSKNVKYEETKCTFRGDAYHEFLIKW